MTTTRERVQKGATWMVLLKFTERGLGLVSTVILARLLIPEDFGLLAMATAVIFLLELLSAFGFDMALIQNRSAERRHYDTAWTFNVLFGVIAAIALVLLAIPVSRFYEEPRLASILVVLAMGPLIGGMENIGVVAFRKDLNFDREFRFLIGKKLAGFVTTVSLALILRSYWALVAGIVVSRVCGVALSYLLHPYRPTFCISAKGELISFSKWLLLNNFISFFYLRSVDFVLGKVAGARALGLYTVAYEIWNLPTTEMIAPINRAIFPGYAKVSADKEKLRQAFLQVISSVALLVLPAAAGIAATAELLVSVILGEQWLDSVPIIQILAFYGAITALETNTYYVHLALGDVKSWTVLIGISAVAVVLLVIPLTIAAGALGAASAYLVTAILFFPLFYGAVIRKLDLAIRQLIEFLWRPIIATTIMYVILQQFLQHITVNGAADNLAQLLGLIVLGASSYCFAMLCLWHLANRPAGAEQLALDNVVRLYRSMFD